MALEPELPFEPEPPLEAKPVDPPFEPELLLVLAPPLPPPSLASEVGMVELTLSELQATIAAATAMTKSVPWRAKPPFLSCSQQYFECLNWRLFSREGQSPRVPIHEQGEPRFENLSY